MKITAMTTMMLVAGAMAYGDTARTAPERSITVCFDDQKGLETIGLARMLARKMFQGIGVNMEWRAGLRYCPENAIIVSLGGSTPATFKPGALAYALPYEGTHIQVFYDRISRYGNPATVSVMLAHVLVHEITHILQGIQRHSETGIMKAHWDNQDLLSMRSRPLSFTPHDIDLIYIGLAARAHPRMMAMNFEPAVAGH